MSQVYNCPLHEHPLEKVNPLTVYPAYGGHWKCDNCSKEHNANSLPFHCRNCSFDLCSSCLQGNISLAHRHPLFFVETSRLYNADWRCDVCRKSSNFLGETFSYHCAICNCDICRNCFQPKQHPIHRHELKVTDTSLIYGQTEGNWFCDVCSRSSRNFEKFSHHCSECEFDVCQECFRPHRSPLHIHPLLKADSHHIYATFNGGWRCDHCGSVHNNPTDNHPWHCEMCSYDLCDDCMGTQIEAPDVTGPSPGQYGRNWHPDWLAATTASVAPTRQPVENPWVLRHRLSPPTSPPDSCPVSVSGPMFTTERGNAVTNPEEVYTDDSSKCIICMENPKNATLIHGDTGHCCCCWLCAQVLKQRRDPCPICRAPIDHVIRQYNA